MSDSMSVYNELRLRQQFCDAVITVDGVGFHVHKVIMCICSPYFRALFCRWSTPDRQIYNIPGVSSDLMKNIVEFAYIGLAPVIQHNAQDLFIAADQFNIMGLLKACSDFMVQELSPENCISCLLFTENYYYPALKDEAFLFTLKHFREVDATSEEFLSLPAEQLYRLTKSDQLIVDQEERVYEAILKWVAYDPEERSKHVYVLLSNVRLVLMSSQYIKENVMKNKFVQSNQDYKATVQEALNVIANHAPKSLLCHSVACPRLPSAILLAVGGCPEHGDTNIIEAFNPRYNLWTRVPYPYDSLWAYHGAVFLEESVYCVGGTNGVEYFSAVHRLDLRTNTWHECSPMHTSRCFVSVTVMDGCIYAMGGFDGHTRLATAERYEPRSNQWTLIAPMHEQRDMASCATLHNRVYICGGFNSASDSLSSAESYDANTDQWTLIASMGTACGELGVVAYEDQIFAVGGLVGLTSSATAEAYNPSTNTWRQVASMRVSRSDFGISVVDNRLFVVGGLNNNSAISEVEYYTNNTNTWTDASTIEISRSALSCCTVHGINNMADYAFPPFIHFPPNDDEQEMEA